MLEFKTLRNFRDFRDYPKGNGKLLRGNVFARSDNPYTTDAEDAELLKAAGFTCIIDLRRQAELDGRPDRLSQYPGFEYHHITMNDASYLDLGPLETPEKIAEAYYGKLSVSAGQIAAIFRVMAAADVGVMFHCESGKDRTGTIAALLLLLNDVDDEVIIKDYHLTYGNLYLENVDVYMADPVLVPKPEVMACFLKKFHRDYPCVDDYFLHIGLTVGELERIRKKFEIGINNLS